MSFRGKSKETARNEEMDYLTDPRDALTPATTEIWPDMVDVLDPPLSHLCIPSCSCSTGTGCGNGCHLSCGAGVAVNHISSRQFNSYCCCFTTGGKKRGGSNNNGIAIPVGYAFDLIVVQSATDPSLVECSDVLYSFDALLGTPNICLNLRSTQAFLEVDDDNNSFVEKNENNGSCDNKYSNSNVDSSIRFPIFNGKLQQTTNQPLLSQKAVNMQMNRCDVDERDPLQSKINTESNKSNNEQNDYVFDPKGDKSTIYEKRSNSNLSFDSYAEKKGKTYETTTHDPKALVRLLKSRGVGTVVKPARIVIRSSSSCSPSSASTSDYSVGSTCGCECCKNGNSAAGQILAVAPLNIYFWSSNDRILVCDIDGTITKSNVGGLIDSVVTQKFQYCHEGVCHFLQSILREHAQKQRERQQGQQLGDGEHQSHSDTDGAIRILYLTSRPLGLSFATRRLLHKLRQASPVRGDGGLFFSGSSASANIGLPKGPLLGFTAGLWKILFKELVTRSVHEFKSKVLQRIAQMWQVVTPAQQRITTIKGTTSSTIASTESHQESSRVVEPFIAGFGNTFMAAQAYHEAGMKLNQIYIINKKSEIRCLDRPKPNAKGDSFDSEGGRRNNNKQSWTHDDYKTVQKTLFFRGFLDSDWLARHVLFDKSATTQTSNNNDERIITIV